MNTSRRRFLQGTAALFCAPAIIKIDNLMRIATVSEVHKYGMTVDANGVSMEELYNFLKREWMPRDELMPLENWAEMGPGGGPFEGDYVYPEPGVYIDNMHPDDETKTVVLTPNKYGIIIDFNPKTITIEKKVVVA